MEERWSGIDYIIEEIDTSVKENGKSKKNSLHKTLENIRQYETPILRKTGIDNEEIQVKDTENTFNKNQRKFPQPKEEDAF